MNDQLDIYGTWTTPTTTIKPTQPFTQAQRLILRHIAEHGHIRSIEAGTIMHNLRPCPYCPCKWRSSDGNEALKRLQHRGIIQRDHPGHWTPTHH